MKLHYRYATTDGEVHEVVADLQVAVAIEERLGKPFHELVAGKHDEQLQVVHEAYKQGAPEGTTTKLYADWRQDVVDYQLDGVVESALPPLDEAERKARKLKSV